MNSDCHNPLCDALSHKFGPLLRELAERETPPDGKEVWSAISEAAEAVMVDFSESDVRRLAAHTIANRIAERFSNEMLMREVLKDFKAFTEILEMMKSDLTHEPKTKKQPCKHPHSHN